MCTSVSFADYPVRIIVQTHMHEPIAGLTVQTTNLKKNVSAVTNENGEAIFKNKCERWKEFAQEYAKAYRENNKTTKRPVHIKIVDQYGKFKTHQWYLQWKSSDHGCAITLYLQKDAVKETFPKPEVLKKLALDPRTGDVKFYSFCTGQKRPSICGNGLLGKKGTVDCGCSHKFKNIDTQPNEAILLAKEYMWNKVISEDDFQNMDIQCQAVPIRSKSNQDFISCTSAGGKYAYDFEFDDITEGTDRVVLTDTAMALCELYGGNFRNFLGSIGVCVKDSPAKTQKMCSKLKGATYDFSWTTEYKSSSKIGSVCVFNYREADKKYNPKDKINGQAVDIRKYENINVRSLPSLEFLIRQYVQTKIGYNLDAFRCAKGFRQYGSKHLLECHAYTGGRDDVVEFVFDDLNEWIELTSNAGEGGVGCIGAGGSFDGSQCAGLTKTQCAELDKKAPGGATWDASINQCTLNDAAKLETFKKIGDYVVTGITIAGTVVLVVATAGTAAPAIAALAMTGGSLSVAGTVSSKAIEQDIKQQVEKFKTAYNNCKNQQASEQGQCARSVLQSYFGYMDAYISKGVFDGQYGKSLDEIFQGLIELTEPEKITKEEVAGYQTQLFLAESKVNKLSAAKIVTVVGDCMLIVAGGIQQAKKILSKRGITIAADGAAVVNTAQKGNKISRFFARVYNLADKTTKPVSNAASVKSTVESGINETGKILSAASSTACWVDGYLVACK